MSAAYAILGLVALQRLIELVYARRNTRRLLAVGAIEHGVQHYPLFVLLHTAWLVTLFAAVSSTIEISWPLIAIYGVLQLGRLWVILSLGKYWTTRIIAPPDAPLVTRGPYRFMRHPNYAVVVAEIAVLPLAFGLWRIALVFSLLNLALLYHRCRIENETFALRPR